MRYRLFIWGLPELQEIVFIGTEDELSSLVAGFKELGRDVTWWREDTLRKLGLS